MQSFNITIPVARETPRVVIYSTYPEQRVLAVASEDQQLVVAQEALAAFQSFVRQSGKSLERISPRDAAKAILQFYATVRVDECDPTKGDDMLLFQWGLYDWDQGAAFHYCFARQFIFRTVDPDFESGAGEKSIWQLDLRLKYKPSPELRAVQPGDKWCGSPDELPEFARYIAASEATNLVLSLPVDAVELTFQDVE